MITNHPAWRCRIRLDLENMQTALDAWPHRDELSGLIRSWHEKLVCHIEQVTENEELFKQFFTLLRQTLVDPLRLAPLDEPFLGKDNQTYGKKVLQIHLSTFPEHERSTLPFSPLKIHTLARHCLDFLARWKQEAQPIREIEEAYAQLAATGKLPPIPEEKAHRDPALQQRIARILQQQQAAKQRNGQREIQLRSFERTMQAGFANIEADVVIQLEAIRNERKAQREEQDRLIQRLSDQDAFELQGLARAIEHYRARVETLRVECEQLEKERQELGRCIDDVQKSCEELKYHLKKFEEEVEKRNSNFCGTLLKVGGSITVCVVASSLLPGGVSVSKLPGGAKLTMTFTL